MFVAGQAHAPAFIGVRGLYGGRVLAIALAAAFAAFAQLLTGTRMPAGGVTALTVALQLEAANLTGGARLLDGLVLVTTLGEATRRLVMAAERRRTH